MADDDAPHDRPAGYGQYCPVTRALEVLGERWSMLIVRDLLCGFTRFNELARGLPGLSRTLLSKRLRQLQAAGVVEKLDDEYRLTPAGEDLQRIVFGLGEWGARWQFSEPRPEELDPELLMWWIHRRLDFTALPDRRYVFEFRFRGRPERYWILRDSQGPSICTHDPGFGVDAVVEATLGDLYEVWLGRRALRAALRDGTVALSGPSAVVRKLPSVLELSPVAYAVTAAGAAADRRAGVSSRGR